MPNWRRTLYIVFFAQVISSAGFSIIFPFLPLYIKDLGSTTGVSLEFWVGMVFSAQAFTMMLAAPVWGTLADRYGRKLMVERAMFGGAIILFLMAFAQSAEQLVAMRAIQGLITGTVAAANALVAAAVPRERVGYAMGLLQTALWSGVAVGPLIGGVLADTLGFHAPFIFTSALLLLAGVAVWWGVDEGFAPVSAHLGERVGFVQEWRHVLATPGVSLTYTLEFLTGLGRFMIVPILPLFMQSLLPPDAAVSTVTGLAVGVSSATATLGAVLLGRLGDRVGHRRIVVACALAGALIYIPQVFVTQAWQILVLQALGGFAMGGLVAAPSALLARYTQPGEEGAVYGIDNSVVSGSRAVAPLMGAGIAAAVGYRGTFAATALLMLGVAILALRCLPHLMPEARLKVL